MWILTLFPTFTSISFLYHLKRDRKLSSPFPPPTHPKLMIIYRFLFLLNVEFIACSRINHKMTLIIIGSKLDKKKIYQKIIDCRHLEKLLFDIRIQIKILGFPDFSLRKYILNIFQNYPSKTTAKANRLKQSIKFAHL